MPCLQGNRNSSGLQIEVAYCPELAVGNAAQLAAAHLPNERTLDPQSATIDRSTYAPTSRTMMAFSPQIFSGNDSLILATYQVPFAVVIHALV